MARTRMFLWGAGVGMVALLNIVDILPDWTTMAAILTLPLAAPATGMRCCFTRGCAR